MKKILSLLILNLISWCLFGVANAQTQSLLQEAIVSYDSNITVNIDNSINVTETITYNTGPQEHHGVYRDIYPYSSQNRKMRIDNVIVTDEYGTSYQFQISEVNGNTRIKIGDPNQTFSGQKIYIIRYHATRAVAQLKDIDEIYWNVIGNEWGMPIYQAQASVVLPSEITPIQSSCYYGSKGSNNQCSLANKINEVYVFNSPSTLAPQEGFTIAIGFTKGIVSPYSSTDKLSNFFDTYWQWLVASILPILTLIFSLLYWYKKGRDARDIGTIIPQYDVPDELSPMEVGGIVNEKINVRNISAEIIYLATKGYLKINQLDRQFIGLIKSTDYEFTKLKDFSDLPNNFDKKLLKSMFNFEYQSKLHVLKKLFSKNATPIADIAPTASLKSIKLSDLKYIFYRDVSSVIALALDALLNKGYYKNLGKMKNSNNTKFFFVFILIWGPLFFGGIIGALMMGDPFPMIIGIFLSIVIYGIASQFSPAKTEKGIIAKEYILGLKMYLQIAEKDRLQFHNAPEKKPETFEKFLPYAMVLGVEKTWAKEFEGIYLTPPTWYSGTSSTDFNAITFSKSMSDFNSLVSTSLSSSGGSGGGGSSGGGGGGGGGGSW